MYVPPKTNLANLAPRASYVGSPEHKDSVSFVGQPRPRSDASLCPREIQDVGVVIRWLRLAIHNGSTGAPWEGDFPRYVWHREGDVVFEARLVNREEGSYKGYPLNKDEQPPGI